MRPTMIAVLALAGLALAGAPPAAAEELFATNGLTLYRFDSATPDVISAALPITGLLGIDQISGIDFRPSTGQLYGLVGPQRRIYTIDPSTGAATLVAPLNVPVGTIAAVGLDFHPVEDYLRVVASVGEPQVQRNLRVNVDTGQGLLEGGPVFTPGVPSPGVTSVLGLAYTNNVPGATQTTLYGIDSGRRTLVRVAPESQGVLNIVGPLGITFGLVTTVTAFDISGVTGTAYAALAPGGPTLQSSQLYTIDLETGAATLVGTIGDGTTPIFIIGLAAAPFMAPVGDCAEEVTDRVRLSASGFYYNPRTRRFSQLVWVQNRSRSPIQGPVSLVLDQLTEGVTLLNPSGITACAAPLGSPYRDVYIGRDNVLKPGEGTLVVLEFTAPSFRDIGYRPRVLAGEGER